MTDERSAYFGTVYLMDGQWLRWIDGNQYQSFTGNIEIHKDDEVLGFTTNGRVQADWFITVVGDDTRLNIFGCQVRAVVEHDPALPIRSVDTLLVP